MEKTLALITFTLIATQPALAMITTTHPLIEACKENDENHISAALIEATKNGNVEQVKQLIAQGANLNYQENKSGWTSLLHAAFEDFDKRKEIAQLLINAQADVDLQAKHGSTPLINASFSDSLKIANMLIAAKANLDLADSRGLTALMWSSYDDPKITLALIKARANLLLEDEEGNTALIRAAKNDSPVSLQNQRYSPKSLILLQANFNLVEEQILTEKKRASTFLLCLQHIQPAQYTNLKHIFTFKLKEMIQEPAISLLMQINKTQNPHFIGFFRTQRIIEELKKKSNLNESTK
jgi:ankyrin repeat protein